MRFFILVHQVWFSFRSSHSIHNYGSSSCGEREVVLLAFNYSYQINYGIEQNEIFKT